MYKIVFTIALLLGLGNPSHSQPPIPTPHLIELTAPDGSSYAFAGPPGSYKLKTWAVVGGKLSYNETTIIISSAPSPPAPVPGPIPPPSPIPQPTPQPIVQGKLWVTAIFDDTKLIKLPLEQREIRNSSTIADMLETLQCEWRSYDMMNKKFKFVDWKPAIGDIPLPCLVIIDDGGKLVERRALPSNEQSIINIVKKLRGK